MSAKIDGKKYTDASGSSIVLEVYAPERRQILSSLNELAWSCRFRITRNNTEVIEQRSLSDGDELDAFLGAIREIRTLLDRMGARSLKIHSIPGSL